jgi:hypothetical protein
MTNSLIYQNQTGYYHGNDLNGWGKKSEILFTTISNNELGIRTTQGELALTIPCSLHVQL